jgi:hypothetical protein
MIYSQSQRTAKKDDRVGIKHLAAFVWLAFTAGGEVPQEGS